MVDGKGEQGTGLAWVGAVPQYDAGQEPALRQNGVCKTGTGAPRGVDRDPEENAVQEGGSMKVDVIVYRDGKPELKEAKSLPKER